MKIKLSIIITFLITFVSSFLDNELSPECLDGAQGLLKGKLIKKMQGPIKSFFFSFCCFIHYLFYLSPQIYDTIIKYYIFENNTMCNLSDDGVSIPVSYDSYICPISSSKLYTESSSFKDIEHMETPYVVKVHTAKELGQNYFYHFLTIFFHHTDTRLLFWNKIIWYDMSADHSF